MNQPRWKPGGAPRASHSRTPRWLELPRKRKRFEDASVSSRCQRCGAQGWSQNQEKEGRSRRNWRLSVDSESRGVRGRARRPSSDHRDRGSRRWTFTECWPSHPGRGPGSNAQEAREQANLGDQGRLQRRAVREKKKKKKSLSFKIGKFSYNSLFQHPHPPTLRKVVVDGVCAAPCLPLPTRTPYQGTNLLHLGFSSPAPFCFKTSGQISRLVDRLDPPASCTCRDY